jgi:hypothetical protein
MEVSNMHQHEIDDINRKLAILAAKYGFAATARKAPRDEAKVIFDAFTWRNDRSLITPRYIRTNRTGDDRNAVC